MNKRKATSEVSNLVDKFQSFLKETIHGDSHLQTVHERMEHIIFFKEALNANNPIKAKEELSAFYRYIKHDHEYYIPPEDLLAAAKGRTHFFHGIIYSAFLDRIKESVFAYSISLINIELINEIKDPQVALDLTYSIIDTYYEFVESYEKIPMSEFSSKVMAYIDLHISDDIRTSTIATSLNMDADYL